MKQFKNKTTKQGAMIIATVGMVALILNLLVGLIGYQNHTAELENIKDRLLANQIESTMNLSMRYVNNFYGELTQSNGTLLDHEGYPLDSRIEAVDAIYQDMGDEASIYVKVDDDFKRISSSLRRVDSNIIGSTLGKDNAAYTTVMNGDTYIGENNILGTSYYTAYNPLKDDNGNVIGLLFTGIPTDDLDELIGTYDKKMDVVNVLTVLTRAVSLGALIILVAVSVILKRD